MLIERPPGWFRLLFPGVLFRMPESNSFPGTVFITFDDGPIPEATPWILDVLDRFGIKATFFMVGQNVERFPHLLEKVKIKGHKVANHTLHHIRGFRINPSEYRKDVEDCEKYFNTRLLRPPHGWLTPGQLKEMKKDYRIVMYDLITRDYSKNVTDREIVNNVKRYTRDGSIIVFHESLKSIEKLKTALPESLEWLCSRGYKFGVI